MCVCMCVGVRGDNLPGRGEGGSMSLVVVVGGGGELGEDLNISPKPLM